MWFPRVCGRWTAARIDIAGVHADTASVDVRALPIADDLFSIACRQCNKSRELSPRRMAVDRFSGETRGDRSGVRLPMRGLVIAAPIPMRGGGPACRRPGNLDYATRRLLLA